MKNKVAFICDEMNHFLVRSMVSELREAGYSVDVYPININAYSFSSSDHGVFIVYMDGFSTDSEKLLASLDIVMGDKKKERRLYLIGSDEDLKKAYSHIELTLVTHAFKRPVNMESVLKELSIINPSYSYDGSLKIPGSITVNISRKSILIVDDDDVYLRNIETWFSDDYNVYTAASVTSALSLLKRVRTDLILLDYEMPLLSGLDFLRILRSEPATEKIPIIFLTAKDDKEIILEILKEGPTGYLLKSTAPILLKHNIKNFFDGKELWWKSE
ncbi:MAG: response regulator [Treponema sp.]|nr:response regulator [Treponema sp.]